MKRWHLTLGVACMALGVWICASAAAQNLSLRGPAWAQPLLTTDLLPTTGGRAALNEADIDVAARITIAPYQGGVARVIRYEARGNTALLALRRFTGHPTSGWWMWGPDTPFNTRPEASVREELAGLVRAAIGIGGAMGGDPNQTCPAGEQVFVEMALGARAMTASRTCVSGQDAVGRLALRLSQLAGSSTEEELHFAAIEELLSADRAFNAKAQSDGVAEAFREFGAPGMISFAGGAAQVGPEAAAARFADLPEGARLEWAPEMARVSTRGDMGWTWGRAVFTAPGGEAANLCYVSIWTRDVEGAWRTSFDAGLAEGCAAP